jgi:hypothetical protein
MEARAVLDTLGSTTMRTTPVPMKMKNLPTAGDAQDNPFLEKDVQAAVAPADFELMEEQADMTVEEFLRYELGLRYEELKVKGEAQIREWEERSKKAREVIAGL